MGSTHGVLAQGFSYPFPIDRYITIRISRRSYVSLGTFRCTVGVVIVYLLTTTGLRSDVRHIRTSRCIVVGYILHAAGIIRRDSFSVVHATQDVFGGILLEVSVIRGGTDSATLLIALRDLLGFMKRATTTRYRSVFTTGNGCGLVIDLSIRGIRVDYIIYCSAHGFIGGRMRLCGRDYF